MLILTSPAKTLDFETDFPQEKITQASFLDTTKKLHTYLQQQDVVHLQKILKTSEKLTHVNFERYQNWISKHSISNSRPALYMFKGDVFRQLELDAYADENLNYAQKSLRILSGFYGMLKPFDLMQAYRLEMGTSIDFENNTSLYSVWKEIITTYLNKEIQYENHTHILNLASKEYSKAIDFKNISIPVIDIHFKEKRGDEYKVVSLLSKRARGMMIDYCIPEKINTLDKVKQFTYNDYRCIDQTNNSLTFIR